ncbi:sugar transporter [Penicillium cinerascens]|uniref:Sugar transporter n=1 Tax=Penicillium cinerascens TaxID=70096 RepID=A0A9W9TEB3_9EURO|nr:sugar transporter [Penicillium cinerascens]KAJ5219456.1 sugar transporter [Penicillium cinerascens]
MTDVHSTESGQARRTTTNEARDAILAHEAHRGVETEHKMSFWQGLRTYPHAVGWSILFSTAIIMEGFDVVLIGNLYALGPFQKAFGKELPNGTYQLTVAWQAGLSNGALVGEILGLFLNGIICDRFGYRKTIFGALALVICFIFIVFFANSLVVLLVGEILLGIPWGVFQTLTTAYASEVCPVVLRPYLTTYVNLCWVLGQFIASIVLKGVQPLDSKWAYKIPFACQWMWPLPIMLGVSLAPESPWWLVRKGRLGDAKKALLRLTSRQNSSFDVDETIAMIERTNELERQITQGTSYTDCFKGVNLRRSEVVCMVWAIQTLCGSTFMGYSTYFYEQAGLASSNAFTMSMVQYALGAIGTMSSWCLVNWFGRRTLYMSGQAAQTVLLLITGALGCIPNSGSGVHWAIGSMLLVYTFCYDATVGPVCYALVSELSSSRLRTKTIILARNLYNITGIITNILTPRMLNPSAWDWGARAGFFWAGSCFLCLVWTYFRLPEPKGRTYAEIDLLFERKVPARNFASTVVDPFASLDSLTISEKKKGHEMVEAIENIATIGQIGS